MRLQFLHNTFGSPLIYSVRCPGDYHLPGVPLFGAEARICMFCPVILTSTDIRPNIALIRETLNINLPKVIN